ncbi:MAG: TPM domain-containing protein [Spirochaetia bacterium]|nr:TPM domain-containing protein [Spirochaetia bacterium]
MAAGRFKAILTGIIAAAGFAALFSGAVYPDKAGDFISDFAGVLAQTDKLSISEMLASVKRETGIEMQVVTIRALDDFEAAQDGIEGYAADLFRNWKVGGDTGNGAVLLISVNDRQIAVEAGGMDEKFYEKIMTEVIQPGMVPHFKEDDYGRGIYEGARALKKIFSTPQHRRLPLWMIMTWAVLLSGAIAAVILLRKRSGNMVKKVKSVENAAQDLAPTDTGEWGGGSSGQW